MKYAILEGSKVVNVIVADQEFVGRWYPGAVPVDDGQFVDIGMVYDCEGFLTQEVLCDDNETQQ